MSGNIFIGTSGWTHSDWRGEFYPKDLHQQDQLQFYADHFRSTEVQKTFNQFPFQGYINKCKERVSDDFVFSVCGNRRITHESGLQDLRGVMNAFFSRLEGLDQMKIVVWEIPEEIEKDLNMLMEFLEILPMQFRHGIEFLNESWLDDETFNMLEEREVTCVTSYRPDSDGPKEILDVGPYAYVRFHGASNGNGPVTIDDDLLESTADRAQDLREDGKDVYLYFLNTEEAQAVKDAEKLDTLLS